MALIWDQALFDELYKSGVWKHGMRGAPRHPHFHYHWFGQKTRLERTIATFLALPGAAQISDIAIIGGGFGWTAEIFGTQGVNAISVDTSDYIVDNEAVSEEAELRAALTTQGFDPDNLPVFMSDIDPNAELPAGEIWSHWLRGDGARTSIPVEQEDLATNGSRNKVKQRLNNNMDGILTEFLLDSMETDAESLTIADRCQSLRPNPSVPVIHLIADGTDGDPRLNNKTLVQWRALLDANGFSQHILATVDGQTL